MLGGKTTFLLLRGNFSEVEEKGQREKSRRKKGEISFKGSSFLGRKGESFRRKEGKFPLLDLCTLTVGIAQRRGNGKGRSLFSSDC